MSDTAPSKFPLHEKLREIPDHDRQVLGEFIEWLQDSKFTLCTEKKEKDRDGYDQWYYEEAWPQLYGDRYINAVLGAYYKIDYDGLMAEKDRMLAEIRLRNTLSDIQKAGEPS